ncbi:hypothetical protein LYNGBM3L_72890 [Moorena producens 3L]|uniref:Uncharacterized protein n=1 Tax=Moorena producens 3L TaxID=489825 RepID=F4Y3Q5_9CYAN|nr:hypothetical protein LYNGBM3L_72890 [Moorena producens 3L]
MADKSIAINPNLISVWLLDAQGTEVLTDAFYKTDTFWLLKSTSADFSSPMQAALAARVYLPKPSGISRERH